VNSIVINLIQIATQIISLLIIVYVVLSYFLSPFHPIRQTVDRLVEPLLAPIRQILPQTGMIDFSPIVLLILVQILSAILVSLLRG
jgi:YggT family protein